MKIYIKQEDAGMSHCDSALRIAMEVWVLERLDGGRGQCIMPAAIHSKITSAHWLSHIPPYRVQSSSSTSTWTRREDINR